MDKNLENMSVFYKIFSALKANKLSLFYIFVLIIIFYFIKGLIYLRFRKDEIRKNWDQYKCKPHILPIAGAFRDDGFFEGTASNFNECLDISSKVSFGVLIRPLQYIFTIITKSLNNIVNTVDKLRNMVSIIRELFQKMIGQTFEQLSRSMSTVQFYTEKFRNLMKKQFAMFQLIYYYLQTMRATFDSFINGPLPITLLFLSIFGVLLIFVISMCMMCPIFPLSFFACPICALCFTPYSLIRMNDGSHRPIKDIHVGDIIYPNQKVLGRMDFKLSQPQMVFGLDKAFASGSHLYYHPDKLHPIRVSECSSFTDITTTNELISLATETHTLYSGNDLFADYYEVSHPELDAEWNMRILQSLNPKLNVVNKPFNNYISGFINPQNASDITGNIVQIITDDVLLYNYGGIICSGNNIVWEENRWMRVADSLYATKFNGKHSDYLYHYTTETSIIRVGGFFFRDFMDTDDKSVYDWWNKESPKYIKYTRV